MKKVLIIGARGMLGQELTRVFSADKNYQVFGWDKLSVPDTDSIDITDEMQVKNKVGALAPEIIINAAAYNAVDKAEEPAEFELAKKLNGLAPGYLAQIAKEIKIPLARLASQGEAGRPIPLFTRRGKGAIFIHYSTDYVFDGRKIEGYKESDKPFPISKYGQSKLLGEQEVQRVGGQYYIVRLQKLFGVPGQSADAKKSFFEVMLELAKGKKKPEVVDEELANFTYAPDLAMQTKFLIEKKMPFGIYHIINEGLPVTWFGAAKILFEMAGINGVELIPVPASHFFRPAQRPKYSVLLNTKLPPLRPWKESLGEFLNK